MIVPTFLLTLVSCSSAGMMNTADMYILNIKHAFVDDALTPARVELTTYLPLFTKSSQIYRAPAISIRPDHVT